MDFAALLPPLALALQARARCADTPCGEGRLVWRLWGEGEPLLLLHGGSGSWLHWIRNIDALVALGRTVVVPDLPGFGDSASPPGGEDADAVVEPLRAGWCELQSRFGWPGPVELAGFSFGGIVAAFWIDRYPQDLRRVVITGSPGFGFSHAQRTALRGWRHLPDAAQRMEVHRHNLRVLMLHDERAIDAQALAIQAVNTPRDRMGRRRLAATAVLRPIFEQSQVPVCFAYGAQDVLYAAGYDPFRQWIATLPRQEGLHLIANAGHWAPYEQPEGWMRAAMLLCNIT